MTESNETAGGGNAATSDGTIVSGKVVTIGYTLRDDQGAELERTDAAAPLRYLHGYKNIVVGLERQLEGRVVGDRLTAVVPPSEGYGAPKKVKLVEVRRSELPSDVQIRKGAGLVVRDPDGRRYPMWIEKVQGPTIYVTPNHPFAGRTLHFEVEVLEVRAASPEEVAHGHAHGPGGTAHE